MTQGSPESREALDLIRLSRAIRFALAAIVLGVSYLNIRFALGLESIETILKDMLGGQELPAMTSCAIRFKTELAGLAFAIPVVAIAAIFLGSPIRAIYISSGCILAVFIELIILWTAVVLPFSQVISNMSGVS